MAPMCWTPPTLSIPSLPSSQEGRRLHQLQAVPQGPGNINDNQPTTSLIRIKYEAFREKEATAGRTKQVRSVGPGALYQSRLECQSLAPAWPLLTMHLWMSILHSVGGVFLSWGELGAGSDQMVSGGLVFQAQHFDVLGFQDST